VSAESAPGELRILAAGIGPRVRLPRDGGPERSLLAALDDRYAVIGSVEPTVGRAARYMSLVRGIHPRRDAWRNRAGLSPRAFRALTADAERRLAARTDPHDVIVMMQTLFGLGGAGNPYVVFTDNIYSLTARFYPAWAPLGRAAGTERARLEQGVCRDARFVFATSDFLRSGLIEDYGCVPERVVTVGLGANVLRRRAESSSPRAHAALFVGVDFRRKGGEVLLRAWPRVLAELPEAELWIVGPKGREPRSARQRGVRWHGFVAKPATVAGLYERARVFVLPSLFEPFGRAVFEAMGCGLPCIVTDRGGIAEAVEPEVDGLVVEAEDPDALADALIALLGDPERAERMGRAARNKVVEGYTWSDVAGRMAPHLERVAG
jgi:glycosyltransferase involved in cell wall biosynthesis